MILTNGIEVVEVEFDSEEAVMIREIEHNEHHDVEAPWFNDVYHDEGEGREGPCFGCGFNYAMQIIMTGQSGGDRTLKTIIHVKNDPEFPWDTDRWYMFDMPRDKTLAVIRKAHSEIPDAPIPPQDFQI